MSNQTNFASGSRGRKTKADLERELVQTRSMLWGAFNTLLTYGLGNTAEIQTWLANNRDAGDL